MLSRRTPQNVLGISQQQTSARPQPSSLSTNILQLHNGTLPQGVNIKLTDDCLQNLLKAAQNGYDVLVHVNRKSITIEIKTNNATSLKFDCHFQRVSGNTIHALCKSNNTFNDVANISIRAQVKPTEQTLQSSRQKAANVQKNLELESNKYRTQLLSAPITKPGERISFKNKTTVNRVGTLPKSIPNPLRNGSSSIGSTSSTITTSSSASNLSLINSNKLGSNNNAQQRGPNDYAALKQQVIHYIASGRFKTQDEIVDHIMSTGLPPGIPPESAKRKIREIICEVAEVYVNPPKIALLPKYHREINIDWKYFSTEDRERVRQALSQTEITAGNNFAPMRHSRRGPFVAPKSKMRKDPATPAMTNSTTTSPDIASDASTCSTPSPVNQMQIDNDYQMISSTKPEKRKLSSNDLSKLSTITTTTTMTSMNSPLNNDVFQPPVKKRLIMNDSSNFPSSSKEVQSMTIESTTTTTKSIPKSSSQSDFQKLRSSPYLKPVSSPQIQQQNGFKNNEKSEKLQNKESHRPKEFTPIDKNQLYNGFTKSKKDEKFVVNGSNISKKTDQSNSKQTNKPQENMSTKFDEVKREKSKIATSESEKDVLCEKEKLLMEFAVESMKKEKEKEKKKEKIKKDNEKIVAEEKVDKRDKNVENNITKLDVNNGISTVEKKIKIEIKLEKQPKEKNEEKIEKEHHNHHKKEKSKDKKDIQKSDTTTTSTTTTMASTIINSTLKEDTFKDPSKIVKDATKEKSSKKDKKLEEKQLKEKYSSINGKMASEKEGSLKRDESEITKKEKKKDKEHKKEHKSSKFEGEIKAPKEKKVKTEILLNSTKLNESSSSNNIATEKPKEKEKHKEKEKSKEKEKTKEKSSKIKTETPEKSKMSTKDAASLASEKLLLKPAEKLSKPVIRETTKPPPKEFKPLNPEKLTPDDIKKIKIQDLLKLLSDPLKPSKSYEEKYPPIRTPADAEVYAKHEMEYYELYEKAYNQLLTVQKDLSIYVERLNKSQTDQEKNKLEEKIRNYAARCLQDDNFRNQRRTVANMTKAIQVLRQRQDDYYGPEQNNP